MYKLLRGRGDLGDRPWEKEGTGHKRFFTIKDRDKVRWRWTSRGRRQMVSRLRGHPTDQEKAWRAGFLPAVPASLLPVETMPGGEEREKKRGQQHEAKGKGEGKGEARGEASKSFSHLQWHHNLVKHYL